MRITKLCPGCRHSLARHRKRGGWHYTVAECDCGDVGEARQLGAFVGSHPDAMAHAAGLDGNPFRQGTPEWSAWDAGYAAGTLIAEAKKQSGIR